MIIYSKCFLCDNYRFDGSDDALYARSESNELFLSWMKKVFLRHCGSRWPVILFVEGHASHITLNESTSLGRTMLSFFVYLLIPHMPSTIGCFGF